MRKILILSALLLSSVLYAQNITLHCKDVSVRELMQLLQQDYGYSFSLSSDVVDIDHRVPSVDIEAGRIEDALQMIFRGQNVQFSINGKTIAVTRARAEPEPSEALPPQASAGKKTENVSSGEPVPPQATAPSPRQTSQVHPDVIKGRVVDETGEPLIGVSVMAEDGKRGAITDLDGRYVFTLAPGDTRLLFSYIGYLPRSVPVAGRSQIDVTLEASPLSLDETIVIGYGTASRKDFTGSVSSVRLSSSPIALTSNTNVLEALKGNVTGLDISATNTAGGTPSMLIRGQNSINGSNDPLVVVDGVIYGGSIGDISPGDIENIDVLKDATSAAAYGSRSANGVILITTKRGRSDKPLISFSSLGSVQWWGNRMKLMDGEQWLETVQARNASTDLSWMPPQEAANLAAGQQTDWYDLISRTGFVQDYHLSFSGVKKNVDYYLSASYANNLGIMKGDDWDRISLMTKVSADIASWLRLGISTTWSRQDKSGLGPNRETAYFMHPYGQPWRDGEGNLERYPIRESLVNPLWGVDDDTTDNIDLTNKFGLTAFALIKCPWVDGLSYRFNFEGHMSRGEYSLFRKENYYIAEGPVDDPVRYDTSTIQKYLASANGYTQFSNTDMLLMDHILAFSRTFGRHSIDATAVATRDYTTYDWVKSSGSDFSEVGNTSLGVYGIQKSKVQKVERGGDKRVNIGYLGRLSYSFDDRYFLTASVRRDGASVFGTDRKWGTFSAVGLAWKPTSESFWNERMRRILGTLKVKASYGRNGNQGLKPYQTLSTVQNGSNSSIKYEFEGSSIHYGIGLLTIGNSELGWERTDAWNVGFESSWLNGRLTLDVDMYYSQTRDQIFNRPIPVPIGIEKMYTSMGQVDNRGVEITLGGTPVQTSAFTWNASLYFWLNRNRIVHLYGEDTDNDGREDDDIASGLFIGEPIGAIYGWESDGIVQEDDQVYMFMTGALPGYPKYVDQDNMGDINDADRKILGYASPAFKLNMSHTLTYKNLQLYFMLIGSFGSDRYFLKSNQWAYLVNSSGYANSNGIYIPYWTPENRSNVYPSAAFSGDGRFLGLQNRTFVRLQDVTLSYAFRQPWVKKAGIDVLKVYASAKNLATLTGWQGADPENGIGVHGGGYPIPTSISIGINLNF